MLTFLATVWNWICQANVQSVVISSLLGYLIHLYRETNKNKTDTGNLIQEIEGLAFEHWCSNASDINNHMRCVKIYSRLKTLSWKINQNKEANRTALLEYRKAVTSDPFDDPNRTLILFENPRIDLISSKAKELRKALGIKKEH